MLYQNGYIEVFKTLMSNNSNTIIKIVGVENYDITFNNKVNAFDQDNEILSIYEFCELTRPVLSFNDWCSNALLSFDDRDKDYIGYKLNLKKMTDLVSYGKLCELVKVDVLKNKFDFFGELFNIK